MHHLPSPLALFIQIDSYSGSRVTELSENGLQVSLFLPFWWACEFVYNSKSLWGRSEFLVVAAYAMTVHKAEGLSLDRVVVNINDREHTHLSLVTGAILLPPPPSIHQSPPISISWTIQDTIVQ
jgi:hypothetical protein